MLITRIPEHEDTMSASKENTANQPEKQCNQHRAAAGSAQSSQKDAFARRMETQTSQGKSLYMDMFKSAPISVAPVEQLSCA